MGHTELIGRHTPSPSPPKNEEASKGQIPHIQFHPPVPEAEISEEGQQNGYFPPIDMHSTGMSDFLSPSSSIQGSGVRGPRSVRPLVRTLPPWISSYEIDDVLRGSPTDSHPETPDHAHVAQHNFLPIGSLGRKQPEPGRKHDAARERLPVITSKLYGDSVSKWQDFARITANPTLSGEPHKIVNEEWLKDNMADLEAPWRGGDRELDEHGNHIGRRSRTQGRWIGFRQGLLRNPMVPLLFRTIIWSFSLIAMSLAGSIWVLSRKFFYAQRASTLMAIVVNTITLFYTIYITYDEYSGKPLGLRSPRAKMRLIFLDLFFIVFMSANLSLAMDALWDTRWGCRNEKTLDSPGNHKNNELCSRQKTLGGVLLIVLVAWILTFGVSVFRLVERMARD